MDSTVGSRRAARASVVRCARSDCSPRVQYVGALRESRRSESHSASECSALRAQRVRRECGILRARREFGARRMCRPLKCALCRFHADVFETYARQTQRRWWSYSGIKLTETWESISPNMHAGEYLSFVWHSTHRGHPQKNPMCAVIFRNKHCNNECNMNRMVNPTR